MSDPRFHFSLPDGLTYAEIATICGVQCPAEKDAQRITGVSSLTSATPHDLAYCAQKAFVKDLKQTKAGIVLVTETFAKDVPSDTVALIVPNPQLCFAKIAQALYPQKKPDSLIHETAVIAPTASVGSNTSIGAYTVIGDNVIIGANCQISSHCTITHTMIGDNTIIYPGARIGQDGFGYVFNPETTRHLKIPQLGKVVIGNYVEIGANVTIDRGAMDDTVIGDGSIIDNLVQIGHNVKLGRGVILVAQSGIAGSSRLGDFAVVAAQGGIADHVTIGDKAQVGAQAGVMRDIPAGARMLGSPAMPIRQFMRQVATLERLSERKNNDD